jgi:hypothetical protein
MPRTASRIATGGMAVLVGLAPAWPAGAESVPLGHYRYEWDGGRTAGGTGIVITYDLTIGPRSCQLTALGFQTHEEIRCEVANANGATTVRFVSYSDGKVVNRYGVAVYKPGQELLRLRAGSAGVLLTELLALKPDDGVFPPAVRFKPL